MIAFFAVFFKGFWVGFVNKLFLLLQNTAVRDTLVPIMSPLGGGKEEYMYCKHCGSKITEGERVCPKCGKNVGSDALKIVLAAIAGLLVVAALVLAVYVGTNGWPEFGSTEPTGGAQAGTTPTDGNPDDVTCKGTYSVADDVLLATKDTVVATMGDSKLTNGELQVYYWMSYLDFMKVYGNYASYMGLDVSKPLDQQIYDEKTGQSWQQYFLQAALESWHQDQALTLEAQKAGFQLDKYYRDNIDGLYEELKAEATKLKLESVEAMLQADMGAAATFENYKAYIERYYTGNLYHDEAYKKLELTAQEIETYFQENKDTLKSQYGVTKESGTVSGIQFVLFYPEGATSETVYEKTFDQAAWDAAKAKAQALLDSWVAGGATEEAFLQLVKNASSSENTAGGGGEANGLTPYFASEVDVRHILLQPKDDTEAEWETCRKKAQALLDSWVAGGATEEAFAALAKEYTADSNGDKGGLYENVFKGDMVEEFDAWIFDASRKYGDYGLVKTTYGYHLMFFVHGDTELDTWVFEEGRQIGDYSLLKTDYGYYVVRFTGAEEGWIYYSRDELQRQTMYKNALEQHPIEVDYSAIVLPTAKAASK